MKRSYSSFLFNTLAMLLGCNVLFPVVAAAQSPGGVSSNLYLWLKAGAGVTQSSNNVSVWANQGPAMMSVQPMATASSSITLVSNGINYNPVIRYDGTQLLSGTYLTTPSNPPLLFAVAIGGSGTGSQNAGNIYSNSPAGATGMMYDATLGTYWVDASGTRCSSTASTTNQASLVRVFYSSTGNCSGGYTALNGVASAVCGSGSLNVAGGSVQIGGRTWDVGGRIFVGDIAEVVYLNNNTATATQIKQVESYLALKYGLTLGNTSSPVSYVASDGTTTFWTGNSSYQNNVFGIGKDNGSAFSQTQSNSMNLGGGSGTGQSGKGNIVLSKSTAMTDKQFLIIGDNGGALTEQTTNVPPNSPGAKRVTRAWMIQNTGNTGVVNLSFDMTGLSFSGGSTAFNYALMVNTNGSSDFTTGTSTNYVASSVSGNLINFTGLNLPNNAVFSMATFGGSVLPVTWISFTATLHDHDAILKWITADEYHVEDYEIEQSYDGVTYSPVGRVTAKNNAGTNEYVYLQTGLQPGLSYYRIKKTDIDGTWSYSIVRTISDGMEPGVSIVSNPVLGHQLNLIISSVKPQPVSIIIFSMQGQLLQQQTTAVQQGTAGVQVNVGLLPPGIYIVRTQVGTDWITNKFIKQ